jgi:hypothetical protein
MRTKRLTMMMMPIVLVATGCSWSGSAYDAYVEVEDFPVLWETAGSYCNRTIPLRLVARNRAEMALCPVGDVPVDFDEQMVLAVTTGRVMSDRYGIRIGRVYRQGSIIKVDVETFRPTPTTQLSVQAASPFHVIVIPRSDLNVEGFSSRARSGQTTVDPLRRLGL